MGFSKHPAFFVHATNQDHGWFSLWCSLPGRWVLYGFLRNGTKKSSSKLRNSSNSFCFWIVNLNGAPVVSESLSAAKIWSRSFFRAPNSKLLVRQATWSCTSLQALKPGGMVGFAASGPNTRTQQLCLFLGVLALKKGVFPEGEIHTLLDQGCFQRTV